jgi:hypothetical protein
VGAVNRQAHHGAAERRVRGGRATGGFAAVLLVIALVTLAFLVISYMAFTSALVDAYTAVG